jgi:CheY-like chemotaxis protein
LELSIVLDRNLPPALYTDSTRLRQVLKNLLSNAVKFTEEGSVELRIALATGGWSVSNESLNRAEGVVSFAVSDTGIGIPPDKQAVIFEAFQQGDMTTARRFGGTGLGLSICREVARLLGGEIRLWSRPGEGSVFTLYLPLTYHPLAETSPGLSGDGHAITPAPQPATAPARRNGPLFNPGEAPQEIALYSGGADVSVAQMAPGAVSDDRYDLRPDDRVLLVIEDNAHFARILLDVARQNGFKGVAATRGAEGLALARQLRPSAITLDIRMPDLDGWKILDALKHDPEVRHIPVHVISVVEHRNRGLEQGAIEHLTKPVSKDKLSRALSRLAAMTDRSAKRLLVVEDDERQGQAVVDLIGNGDVVTTVVGSGAEALRAVQEQEYDCVVLDLGLPDIDGFDLIERIAASSPEAPVPIIVYTARDLTREEETRLRKLARSIVVKDATSPGRLVHETTLFLHRVAANLPERQQQLLREAEQSSSGLSGKIALIVDDDVRNVFALSSVLERHGMRVLFSENGKDGIETLLANPEVDIVLMDIMMPDMDGHEAIRRIRSLPQFASLPIIAVTARAMKSDREQCLQAGASDYISKPVDVDHLLSLLRVWLYREAHA